MKNLKTIALFLFAAVTLVSCKQSEQEETATKEVVVKEKKAINPDELASASFTIEGMSCEIGCAAMLEKKLAKMEGVQNVKINFEKKLAKVSYDKTQQVPANFVTTVESAIDGKTYTVSDLKTE